MYIAPSYVIIIVGSPLQTEPHIDLGEVLRRIPFLPQRFSKFFGLGPASTEDYMFPLGLNVTCINFIYPHINRLLRHMQYGHM